MTLSEICGGLGENFHMTSITMPNGVVNVTCYSGRQFVSVASHVCERTTSLMQPPVYECAGTVDCGLGLP